jgi:predicted RNase H-like HicB family nuclease
MLARYLDTAMELATYEIIEDDGRYWGEIPRLQGVWARHDTLAGCQRELREALSDWVALRLRFGLEIPELAHMNLNSIGTPANA